MPGDPFFALSMWEGNFSTFPKYMQLFKSFKFPIVLPTGGPDPYTIVFANLWQLSNSLTRKSVLKVHWKIFNANISFLAMD